MTVSVLVVGLLYKSRRSTHRLDSEAGFSDYLKFLQYKQGVTTATIRTYRSGLNQFHRFLTANMDAKPTTFHLTLPMFRAYLYEESARGLRPRSLLGKFDEAVYANEGFRRAEDEQTARRQLNRKE